MEVVDNHLPEIARYTCYRRYLEDIHKSKKTLRSGFSFRKFAQMAGFKSPNYLQLVIQGKRNLTHQAGQKIARALKLTNCERQIFLALISYEQAKGPRERDEALAQRLIAIKRHLAKELPVQQSEVLDCWYHLLVRELVLFSNFEPSGEFISRALGGLITPKQAEDSFAVLLRAGFITKTTQGYQMAEPVLITNDDDFAHVRMQKLHSQTLKVWSENLDRLSPAQQELGLLNIPISSDKIPELREKIRKFQDEIIGWVQNESSADRVVQLGTYLVPFPSIEE